MVDHQAFTIALCATATIAELETRIEEPGGDHLPLRTATQKAATPSAKRPAAAQESPGEPSAAAPATPPTKPEDTPVEGTQGTAVEQRTQPAAARTHREPEAPGSPELEVNEDPITGRWTFELLGQHVEVDPHLGYVRIKGAPQPLKSVHGLTNPEDLAGAPLDEITRLLNEEH
jgi:hypothetical protein